MTVMKPSAPSSISCCTCETRLSEVPQFSESEKAFPEHQWLQCCPRVICGRCLHENPRFNHYCPYCQISSIDNLLPPGLKDPPSYTASTGSSSTAFPSSPPPYSEVSADRKPRDSFNEKSTPDDEPAEDVLHFLNHPNDSVNSLSLLYGIPASALRRANNISSDHLILGRRTVVIPGQFYKGGVSLSPTPVEGEEEERRKAKIRRWMVACKVHEYDVALLYLEQAGYDVQLATDTYFADEEWERTHPAGPTGRGKGILSRRR